MNPEPAISLLLRQLRVDAGLTLEQLAERSGVSVRGLSDIERGVSSAPRRSTLEAISVGLELDGGAREALLSAARRARTVDSGLPSTLRPTRLADFTGRQDELVELDSMLSAPEAVVVITGPGGFGKTTLALEAASLRAPAEAVAFVDLAGHGRAPLSPLEVVQSVLRQVDDDLDDPPSTLPEAVARWGAVAAARRPLVLLDNVANESQARPVIQARDRGPAILTSRRTIAGITATGRLALNSLTTDSSVELLERIIPARQRESEAMRELATLCNGVPLALRIAGNRVASRPASSVRDYVGRMRSEERRLGLLVAGDLSVEAVLAVSYQELDDQTAALFRSISIIDGLTFDSRIAAAAFGRSRGETERGLEHLVDLGMLELRGGDRYRLHDLLRVFAGSRLRLASTAEDIHIAQNRLMYWLLRVLVTVVGTDVPMPEEWDDSPLDDDPLSADEAAARVWVLGEADHWWPAVRRAAAIGDHEAVLAVVEVVQWKSAKWHEWGRWHELNELALRSAVALGDRSLVSRRTSVLAWTAMTERGDPVSAQSSALAALEIAEAVNDQYAAARAHYFFAWSSLYAGRTEGLEEHLEAAITGFVLTDATSEARQARTMAGVLQRRLGRLERAIAELSAVLDELPRVFVEADEDFATSFSRTVALEELANTFVEIGDADAALRMADTLISMIDTLDTDIFTARSRIIRARALLAAARTVDALAELATVDALLSPYPRNGHVGMIVAEMTALRVAAQDGGSVPGAIADLNAEILVE